MPTLEDRVGELEVQMRKLMDKNEPTERTAGWEKIVGTFAASDGFEEAVRLGKEYRQSLRPKDEEESA